jgi:uncharacterized lipoprotein YmbA
VAGDLSALLGTARVAAMPAANFTADYQVTVNIERFETVPGKSVLVDAIWVVRPPSHGTAQTGRTVATEPVPDDSYDALAAGHSRALAKISSDIAAAIRSAANGKS